LLQEQLEFPATHQTEIGRPEKWKFEKGGNAINPEIHEYFHALEESFPRDKPARPPIDSKGFSLQVYSRSLPSCLGQTKKNIAKAATRCISGTVFTPIISKHEES
jgi:hypothetical protein